MKGSTIQVIRIINVQFIHNKFRWGRNGTYDCRIL